MKLNIMSNLNELRKRKEFLEKELDNMEEIMAFSDKKKSLGFFTNGFTDRFLDRNNDSKVSLKTAEIAKYIGQLIQKKMHNNIDNTGLQGYALENVLKAGGIALMGNLAKKTLQKGGWQNKLLGTAMVYLLPITIKFIGEKIDDYQRKKSFSSLEKLI